MALETATYISDLVSSNPTSSDGLSQGDDHLRLLKSTLKATFPNISGVVTPTQAELNYVDGVTSPLQSQIDAKAPLASPTFTGTVVLPSTTSVGNVSSTELGYLDGVTSAIQTQIDGKAASVHTHGVADITGLGSLATLNTVNTAQIVDGSVSSTKLASDSVTTAKIVDANVTTAKIADASITPAKLNGAQSGSAPVYGARAWVTFDGTTSPPSISASGNVSSVSRSATGDYTINFTTALPDANYAVSAIGKHVTDAGNIVICVQGTPTTSAIRIQCTSLSLSASTASTAAYNPSRVSVVVFD